MHLQGDHQTPNGPKPVVLAAKAIKQAFVSVGGETIMELILAGKHKNEKSVYLPLSSVLYMEKVERS